ncbi:MAG: hypothetical protein KFF73_14665 [Cyclobacteriaceae bacterium]|nr:hypothetical protein [Cyclobacteriaceae bacterium]
MNIAVGIYMFVHGFAHIVGFLISWKLINDKDTPYKTTILGGKFDMGDNGIRILGILWLLTGIAFFILSYGVITLSYWWNVYTFFVIGFSLMLSILAIPDTVYGILANILLLLFLWYAPTAGWIS